MDQPAGPFTPADHQPKPAKPPPSDQNVDYEDLLNEDLDMDDFEHEALTAPAYPHKVGPAGEVMADTSPGVAAVAQIASSNHEAVAVPRSNSTKPSSNIFAAPAAMPKAGAAKRKRVVETSSPDKAAAETAAVKILAPPNIPADESDLVLLAATAPRPEGKLVKAGSVARNASKVFKANGKKQTKKKLAADGCPFFDLRAENSDDPDSETDPEDDYGGPETFVKPSCLEHRTDSESSTTDRHFVDSNDFTDPSDMSRFYRESLMTQVDSKFKQGIRRLGQYKMRVE